MWRSDAGNSEMRMLDMILNSRKDEKKCWVKWDKAARHGTAERESKRKAKEESFWI